MQVRYPLTEGFGRDCSGRSKPTKSCGALEKAAPRSSTRLSVVGHATMPGMRVDGSARSIDAANRRSVNLQLIAVGVGWIVALVVCLVILTSRADSGIKTVVGIALLLFSLSALCFAVCTCYGNSKPTVKRTAVKVTVDPLQPCALCGMYLGELCKMHGPKDAVGRKAAEVCPCTRGKCGHTYHFHCLAVYLDQCASSRKNAMCPDVTDPFLWEFASRTDKGRYAQWMADRPMPRRNRGKTSPTAKFRTASSGSLAAKTFPAPGARSRSRNAVSPGALRSPTRRGARRTSRELPSLGSSGRHSRENVLGAPPQRAVPVPVGRPESRRMRLARGGSGSLRRVTAEDHQQRMLGLRQLPMEMHKMQSNLAKAREDMAEAKAVLERETHQQKMEKLRSREAVRNAQAAWQRQTQTVESLKGQMEAMEEEKLCAVCLENKKNMAFQCGHQVCEVCSPELQQCPFCRCTITTRIKLYA